MDLGMFEGQPILATSIAIRNTGDGLSQAMAVEPQLLTSGQRVYVVLECDVTDIDFKPVKDPNIVGMTRQHVLRAGAATIIDASVVIDAVAAQKDRIRRAQEESEGVQRLALDPDVDDIETVDVVDEHASRSVGEAHADGDHDGAPHPNCAFCDQPEPDGNVRSISERPVKKARAGVRKRRPPSAK